MNKIFNITYNNCLINIENNVKYKKRLGGIVLDSKNKRKRPYSEEMVQVSREYAEVEILMRLGIRCVNQKNC